MLWQRSVVRHTIFPPPAHVGRRTTRERPLGTTCTSCDCEVQCVGCELVCGSVAHYAPCKKKTRTKNEDHALGQIRSHCTHCDSYATSSKLCTRSHPTQPSGLSVQICIALMTPVLIFPCMGHGAVTTKMRNVEVKKIDVTDIVFFSS